MQRTEQSTLNRHQSLLSLLLFIAAAGILFPVAATVPVIPLGVERQPNGNTLIADGRIFTGNDAHALEVDSLGRLVWAYIKCDVPFLHTARRTPTGTTLLSASFGNRVIEVNRDGDLVWAMTTGLNYPNDACRLSNGHTLITVRNDNRVIEVDSARNIVWSYNSLNAPHNGNRLTANGHTFVCDGQNNRVLDIDSAGSIFWQYGTGIDWARCVQRLPDGHTLIADSHHDRVIELDQANQIVWRADSFPTPYTAQRLPNGNTVISAGTQVLEISYAHDTVWRYPNTFPVLVETLQVVNPTSGCSLYVHIHRPSYASPDNRVPGIVFVPGGKGYGSSFDSDSTPDHIASDGFAFLHFDPDGRGLSGAYPENYDGYVHQDGLHACLEALASRDYVDTTRLGIYTRQYGITMGAGAIARYPEPRVKFLFDFEGLADRYQSCKDSLGPVPMPVSDDSFWQEREAARFIKYVPGAYLRFQSMVDSNPRLVDNHHCIQMIDSATRVTYGGSGISAWTRVNDSCMNPANRTYSLLDQPQYASETQEVQYYLRELIYLHELSDMELPGIAEQRGSTQVGALRVAPRPCRGALRVDLPPAKGPRELLVHDPCGRLVSRTRVPAGRKQLELDLRDLRPGVYYVSAVGAGAMPVVIVH